MFSNMKTQCRKNKNLLFQANFFSMFYKHIFKFSGFPHIATPKLQDKEPQFWHAYFVFSSVHKVCMHMFYFFKGKVTASKRQFYIKSSCKWHMSGHCIGQSNKIQVNKLDSICQFRAYLLHFMKNSCINQAFFI